MYICVYIHTHISHISIHTDTYIYIIYIIYNIYNIYIYIHTYAIMKTMLHPSGYQHNGFVVTHALVQ